eukprot:185739-Pyramimonas_sp.AAC.1
MAADASMNPQLNAEGAIVGGGRRIPTVVQAVEDALALRTALLDVHDVVAVGVDLHPQRLDL